jgi:flagellar export protein FliJ
VFNFRLQRVLELREQKEKALATRLVEAKTRADEMERARAVLAEVRSTGSQQLVAAHSVQVTVGQLRNLSFVLDRIDQQLAEASTEARAAEAQVESAQAELTAAFRDRRVLDRLREKARLQWQQAEVQADRTLMDEIALVRYGLKNGTSTDTED